MMTREQKINENFERMKKNMDRAQARAWELIRTTEIENIKKLPIDQQMKAIEKELNNGNYINIGVYIDLVNIRISNLQNRNNTGK